MSQPHLNRRQLLRDIAIVDTNHGFVTLQRINVTNDQIRGYRNMAEIWVVMQ